MLLGVYFNLLRVILALQFVSNFVSCFGFEAGVVYPQKVPKDLTKYLDNDLGEGGHGGEEGLEIVNEVDNCFDCGTCEALDNGKFKCI